MYYLSQISTFYTIKNINIYVTKAIMKSKHPSDGGGYRYWHSMRMINFMGYLHNVYATQG